jgi:hypothetical protein
MGAIRWPNKKPFSQTAGKNKKAWLVSAVMPPPALSARKMSDEVAK